MLLASGFVKNFSPNKGKMAMVATLNRPGTFKQARDNKENNNKLFDPKQ